MTSRIDVSIGPVQAFVAQSRRTRDLWGSSYLLSFLAGHAMSGAVDKGGRIVRPNVDNDPLCRWIRGQGDGEAPRMGSLPNRFAIETDGNPRDVAEAAIARLEAAWDRACKAVWDGFVEPAAGVGNGTRDIWQRQVGPGAFWEIAWTAEPAEARSGLLARRKLWRSHRPPDEPGDKCTVMRDRQELSGFERARGSGDGERQNGFWSQVRGRLGSLELRDDERLCAIAMVKRLFPNPKVAREALGWDIDMSHWPSTVYVGALPWIRKAASAVPRHAKEYADEVERFVGGDVVGRRPPFAGLDAPDAGNFPKLDANFFHRDSVRSERLCPLRPDAGDGARKRLDGLLEAICAAERDDGRAIGPPGAFYALLLADGDRLGRLVEKLHGPGGGEGRPDAGKALAEFTREAPNIVKRHDGVTVYAGGDDVLAMLAVPKALACAAALSECYRSSFDRYSGATLSAAVVFAHVRLPLAESLAEAHRLLDDVAKDGNGRDSLAAGVLKPGGPYCQWATTWDREGEDGGFTAVKLVEDLAGCLGAGAGDPGLSSALIYRIRASLAALSGGDGWHPGAWGSLPDGLDAKAFLRAEIRQSLAKRTDSGVERRADELAGLVLRALRRSRASCGGAERTSEAGGDAPPPANPPNLDQNDDARTFEVGVDALLLARFLADPAQADDRA